MDGAGKSSDTVLTWPRPFLTSRAFSEKISVRARFVVQTLSGSKFAFKTKTGAERIDLLVLNSFLKDSLFLPVQ